MAERELNEAVRYYERAQPGLGVAFLTEVRRCTELIVEHPLANGVVLSAIRRHLCRRFPYALLYTIAGEDVRILAVMNVRRRPGYWIGRS